MLIDIRNLRVSLGGKAILHGVNLSLEAGEIYGLIGPNGAGKSTAIAVALGLVTALGALLAVVTATDSIAGERERGSLADTGAAAGAGRRQAGRQLIVWAVMFAIAVPYLWAVARTGQNLSESIAVLALFGTPTVLGFGFFVIGLAARMASARSCLLTGLIALIISASPLLLGSSLRQTAIGRGFDQVNPFSAALNAYDVVIIDSQSTLAQAAQLAVILGWLALALALALASFRRVVR